MYRVKAINVEDLLNEITRSSPPHCSKLSWNTTKRFRVTTTPGQCREVNGNGWTTSTSRGTRIVPSKKLILIGLFVRYSDGCDFCTFLTQDPLKRGKTTLGGIWRGMYCQHVHNPAIGLTLIVRLPVSLYIILSSTWVFIPNSSWH